MNAMTIAGRGTRRSMRGVTLVELMIVCVVIAILATIAIPSYRQYMLRTHRAEGKATLMQTAQELERCYTRFNAYNAGACTIATTLGGAGVNSTGNHYTITATPTASAYTLTAAPQGPQAQDTGCGNLTLTQAGARGQSGTATNCW